MTASNCPSLAKKRCIVRDANFEKLDQACHVWFLQQRSNGDPLSGPLLRKKALQLTPHQLLIRMSDFDDLFHSRLGYTENDPNWTVPKD